MRQNYKTLLGARSWRNQMFANASAQTALREGKTALSERTTALDVQPSSGNVTNTHTFLNLFQNVRGCFSRFCLAK